MSDTGFESRRVTRGSSSAVDRFDVPSSGILAGAEQATRSDLDSPRVLELHHRLLSHYLRELDAQAPSRREMEMDEAFYDHDQWDPEDAAILRARGQEPLTYNIIAQSVNWILGTERRTRTDYRILPRRKDGGQQAERKSQLLKYLSDTNLTEFKVSRAFADGAKPGLGWLECGVQDDTEGEPIYEGYVSWRNMIYDTSAQEPDLSDSRFMFRTKWLDSDTTKALFPTRDGIIDASVSRHYEWGPVMDMHGDEPMDSQEQYSQDQNYSSIEASAYERPRLRVIEAWFRVPETTDRIAGGDFSGEIYDPTSPGHVAAIENGEAEIRQRPTFRMYVMVMTLNGVLWFSESPYRHNQYPFTPIFGYRKASDGTPYGVIRGMRDAQKDVNKRFSKAQAILNTNKTIMDKGAVDDLDEFAEEVSRPDAIIVKNQGKQLDIGVDRDLAPAHLEIMQISMNLIQTLSGVTDEAMGRTTNATSGRAIMARQEQGQMSTAQLFDNLRLARQHHGAKVLSLIEQYMSEEKTFRITNQRGNPEYITINDGLPENDITRSKADYIISEEAWNATLRQAAVDQFMEMLTQVGPVAPNVVMSLLDLVVEMMDLPNGEEVVRRIRQITGMEDPDADPNQPDPDREAREAQKAKEQAMQERAAEAEIAALEGRAQKEAAQAQKVMADTAKTAAAIPTQNVETQDKAFDLAAKMLAAIGAAPVADRVLEGAGYKGDTKQ
jgi:hypothetical protein